ncbi:bifunctional tetrahydrofolate synthase/dihydrofolate synthase [Isoalcanivorax indicus]|uniref:bifunctional tetrahydrofolate synthase/dihydrofolate synthase n=1 Tax=Isoalcanivorax indicus TaxID=2202653 RepID=UPI000DBA99B3|nr:bifunctional tetrahydrofolate synthase/dihydrofolate synthase [Isoalcanivorax indicus]
MNRSLADWQAHIESLHHREIEMGLDRLTMVAARLQLLKPAMPVITVAGTNGKGSTVALLDALARDHGLRTGVYTSPHILRFNERVRVDGHEADDALLCRAFEAVDAARGEVPLTYFEFTTLAAFWVFRCEAPDLLILEVGLGGRLDAVNLVDADVAIITSVGLDHTDWLGDTRELIAAEKAGIRRRGRPLLYGERDMPAVIATLADADQVPLWRAGDVFGGEPGQIWWRQEEATLRLPLAHVWLGEDNLAAAVQALVLLGHAPVPERIAAVATELRLPGRCQHLRRAGVDWYLDVGHNREALARFLARVPAAAGGRTLAVCAMLADKPVAALTPFHGQVDEWFLADLAGPRGGSAERLAAAVAPARCHATVEAAVEAALRAASPGDRVLVFGSFYTVAEATPVLSRNALPES